MRVSYLLVSIACLSYRHAGCSATDDYADPLDMLNYDRATKTMQKATARTSGESAGNDDRCRVFLPRFVNMLLKNTGISDFNRRSNNENNKRAKSYVSVALSVEDLHLLETMTATNEIDYLEIDRILNSMFTVEKKSFSGFPRTNYFVETYQIKEVLYWISIGSIIIFLLYIIFRNIRQVFSVTFVVFIIFTLAFASTWYTMYMKANINRSVHLEYMPAHCNSKTGGWFPWFSTNNLDECKKYREAIYLNPKYSIALTEVLAEMLSKTLMKPIESLGQSIYVFNKSALKDFPIWAQMIMVPIIIIIIIKTLLLSCALLVGRNLSMKSIFGYGSTSIGPGPTNNERRATSDKINNSIHRMVSEQPIPTQMPAMPKFNFNINLFHPNTSFIHQKSSKDTSFSINNEKITSYEANDSLISMLKNEEIDCVDNKNIYAVEKRRRHRTLSI